MALALPVLAPLAPAQGPREHGFELIVPTAVALPAAGRQSFVVALVIPDGFYVSRDAELGLPALEVEGLDPGIAVEMGPEARPEAEPAGEVYRGRYTRTVTFEAVRGATFEACQPVVSLRFASCDASLCYPPWTMRRAFDVRVAGAGEGEVTYEPARVPADGGRSLYYGLVAVAVGFVLLRVLRSKR